MLRTLLRPLLLAALAMAATASVPRSRKLLDSVPDQAVEPVGCNRNECTRNGVKNGCVTTANGDYACNTPKWAETTATKCSKGEACRDGKCVKQPKVEENECTRAHVSSGCVTTKRGVQYACTTSHGKTEATACTGGSVCDPSLGFCVSAQPQGDAVCVDHGVTNGCLTLGGTTYACKLVGSGMTRAYQCQRGTVCDTDTVDCVRTPKDEPQVEDNACTQNGVSNGCILERGTEYVCRTEGGATEALPCPSGLACDPSALSCIRYV